MAASNELPILSLALSTGRMSLQRNKSTVAVFLIAFNEPNAAASKVLVYKTDGLAVEPNQPELLSVMNSLLKGSWCMAGGEGLCQRCCSHCPTPQLLKDMEQISYAVSEV